ncbi:MAG: LPXTG cell wall anchor domain-containing protein [Bacteroidota bacterium]
MKKSILLSLALILMLLLGTGEELLAQCPMCRATAESNLANGGTEGRGLNNGILYLLGMPYLLIGTIAFVWWRNRKKDMDEEEVLV